MHRVSRVSSECVTGAPTFSLVADVAIVKGETPAGDRTWLSLPDGTAHRGVVHVIHDLPHLVVESVFGLPDGLWGTLAAGGFAPATRELTKRRSHIRLVTDAPPDELAARNWPAHKVAKAAVNAVLNRWGDGPNTPEGVRARLRGYGLGQMLLRFMTTHLKQQFPQHPAQPLSDAELEKGPEA